MKKILTYGILLVVILLNPSWAHVAISPAPPTFIVLSGDVGGTNARFRLSEFTNGKQRIITSKNYQVATYPRMLDAVIQFVNDTDYRGNIHSICLAVAGPVQNNQVKFTNSTWAITAAELVANFNTPKVKLLNDFEAVGYGLQTLTKQDLYQLQNPKTKAAKAAEPNTKAVTLFIGAGTGFGTGYAVTNDKKYTVFPTESGHTSFAPIDDLQLDLLNYFRESNLKVSTEFLLSGPGLANIYTYFRTVNPYNYTESRTMYESFDSSDKNAGKLVLDFALTHRADPMSNEAVRTFATIYGAKAGDLALTFLPYNGIYIVGAIAGKLLTNSNFNKLFLTAFNNKDKMANLLATMPIMVVKNTEVGLQGAEYYGYQLAMAPSAPTATNNKPLQTPW